MTTITMQRDLVLALKKETSLNVGILSKLQAMSPELSRQLFKENALEKPTQNLFNHLSYYLVSVIEPPTSTALPWPLYDTKTERAYRNELSAIIADYSSKGLLYPVMSSYLVNPGCYKVTMLLFQLSQLAVQKMLSSRMNKDCKKKLYNEMAMKYRSQDKEEFMDNIEKETDVMLSKFSKYLHKRQALEKIAVLFRSKITKMESKLSSLNAQKYIDDSVDGFINQHTLDDATRVEILKIKNVNEPCQLFDSWLTVTDEKINNLEKKWDETVIPFLATCKETLANTEALIARHTGEADRNSYIIEYNPRIDEICTNDLQNQVNSQQKYVLKNIIKDNKLNFPNLVRGFLIAICFILKNAEIGDEIYKFNEYLEGGRRNYTEIVSAMRILINRVMNVEAKLQLTPVIFNESVLLKDLSEIPPIPDLSDLRGNRELQCQVLFDAFTPLSVSKHQFNLRRNNHFGSFAKPQQKSLVTPFYQGPRGDFLQSLISCRVTSYDRPNISQNFHNLSIISHANNRANETIAECSSGFTKQQILRLLSTKKSSSSKKFKYRTERPEITVKKGGLFNEFNTSTESNVLFRSYSSPNLFENREKRSFPRAGQRKLSIMQENSPSLLEVSGIAALEKDNSYGTPQNVESSRKLIDARSLPVISITPEPEAKFNELIKDFEVDLNKEISINDSNERSTEKSKFDIVLEEAKIETPKMNTHLIRKTSSLEKIINRFKRVRASILPLEKKDEDSSDFKTIVEEKETLNDNVNKFMANKILLPDLLSPSCSALGKKSTDFLDEICFDMDENVRKKPRESLGTALGVDQTFLDQFDLID